MSGEDRATREENVIKAIREWLPELGAVGTTIEITALDPKREGGALFRVSRNASTTFVCRRGGDR